MTRRTERHEPLSEAEVLDLMGGHEPPSLSASVRKLLETDTPEAREELRQFYGYFMYFHERVAERRGPPFGLLAGDYPELWWSGNQEWSLLNTRLVHEPEKYSWLL